MSESWNVFEHSQSAGDMGLVRVSWVLHTMMDSNDVHLIPVDDSIQHDLSTQCSCRPMGSQFLYPGFPGWEATKYTHNAQDGRESLDEQMGHVIADLPED